MMIELNSVVHSSGDIDVWNSGKCRQAPVLKRHTFTVWICFTCYDVDHILLPDLLGHWDIGIQRCPCSHVVSYISCSCHPQITIIDPINAQGAKDIGIDLGTKMSTGISHLPELSKTVIFIRHGGEVVVVITKDIFESYSDTEGRGGG